MVCGIRGYRALMRRRSRRPATALWFEFSLAAAAIVSFGVSQLIVSAIKHAGGYTSLPLPTQHFVSLADIPRHVAIAVEGIFILYGAYFGGLSSGVAAAIAVVHLVGVALALWGFFLAFRHFFSAEELIVPVVAAGIVVNLAAYIFSVIPATWFDTREIAAVLPLGAVLAGRLLAGRLLAGTPARAWLRRGLAGVLACYVLALGYAVAQPAGHDTEEPVVGWLEAHHLSTGLGTYTEANLITLDSGGRVAIRTVSWNLPRTVPRAFESDASWYDPRLSYANFVVINSTDAKPGRNGIIIPYGDLVALAGPPVHTYHYKTFTIWVWNHNLLGDLGSPPSAFPGNIY